MSSSSPAAEEHAKSQEQMPLSWVRVLLLGACLLGMGTVSFRYVPGLLQESAKGEAEANGGSSPWVNAFYCSAITLTTVGFGDVCPGKLGWEGRVFLVLYTLGCVGFFCGPVLELVSSTWRNRIPQGFWALASLVLAAGVAIFSWEGYSQSEALYASVIVGTTIGYGDETPKSDLGKVLVALYAILVVNVMAVLLQPSKEFLEQLCRPSPPRPQKFAAGSAADKKADKTD